VSKEYTLAVWDLKLIKVDEDGEPLTDNKGNLVLFDTTADLSFICDNIYTDELIQEGEG
jgi:hypothetical protein